MAIQTPKGRPVDRRVYEEELLPWLPDRILDIHVHIYLREHIAPVSEERKRERWTTEIATQHSFEEMRDNFQMLFPEQRVSALVFGYVTRETDVEVNNRYVLDGISDPRNDAVALFVTRPEYDPSVIEQAISGQGFLGIKPYPDLSPQKSLEVSVYDFLPREHLEVLDRLGGIVMLHIPRVGRLADPDNIREVLEIADEYPGARLIVAHVGRAYCLPTARRGLPRFAGREDILFDITANVNPDVIELALQTAGPDRLLFGSDLPIMLMRGYREYDGEDYINYTDGPYSWNTNRKSPEIEANYTFFLYEGVRALITAVKRLGMGRDVVEKVMYSNGARLLGWPADGSSGK